MNARGSSTSSVGSGGVGGQDERMTTTAARTAAYAREQDADDALLATTSLSNDRRARSLSPSLRHVNHDDQYDVESRLSDDRASRHSVRFAAAVSFS